MDLNPLLREQLEWHWQGHLRPRLDGLTDDEYFWEPVAGAWNVRPRGTSSAPMAAGAGAFTIDWAWPEPEPAPLTTIAWRLGHVIVGVLAMRNASHFGGAPADYESWEYAGTAAGALPSSTSSSPAGSPGSRHSARRGSPGPVAPRKGRSRRPPRPRSCCTSTAS